MDGFWFTLQELTSRYHVLRQQLCEWPDSLLTCQRLWLQSWTLAQQVGTGQVKSIIGRAFEVW